MILFVLYKLYNLFELLEIQLRKLFESVKLFDS